MHLCTAPLDRLAMRQQHFLPLLKSCSYPHLLYPQGLFTQPSPGPQTLESGDMTLMARSPSMTPLTQLVSPTLELMLDPWLGAHQAAEGLWRSDKGKQSLQDSKAQPFFLC